MRNFIIFFDEKEGSSPLVRLLDNHPSIDIIKRRTSGVGGWEPFDTFNCGGISIRDFKECLDHIYGDAPLHMDALNAHYIKTGRTPLDTFQKMDRARGFKMRLRSPMDIPGLRADAKLRRNPLFAKASYALRAINSPAFRSVILQKVKEYDLHVFVTVRQDIFRWALSKYHGDGTGRKGHLQFDIAKGRKTLDDIPRIRINPTRLKRICQDCRNIHGRKSALITRLRNLGIDATPVFYEDFLADKHTYFKDFLGRIEIENSDETIETMLEQGTSFRKVHSEDISTFVENHEEITAGFANWQNIWSESVSGKR